MKKNIALNGFEKKIIPFQLAVSFKEGKQQMTYSTDEYAHSLVSEQITSDFSKTGMVECTTIEKIFKDHNIDVIDILKMDIEGLEYEVLYALPHEYYSRIRNIALEIHIPILPIPLMS